MQVLFGFILGALTVWLANKLMNWEKQEAVVDEKDNVE